MSPAVIDNLLRDTELQGDLEMAKRSVPGSWGQIFLIAVFTAFTDYGHRHPLLLTFVAFLIVACNLLRFFLGIRRDRYFPEKRSLWRALFIPSILIPALAWGLVFFDVVRIKGLIDYTTTVALLIGSGICASITSSVSPNRRLGLAFITLVLGPPLIALFLRMDPKAAGLALIFIAYYAFLAFQLSIHFRIFWSGVEKSHGLLYQRNRLQGVVDAIPGLVLWVSTDLKYQGVNLNYALNYNGSRDEFLDRPLSYKNTDRPFINAVEAFVESPSTSATIELQMTGSEGKRWHLIVMRKLLAENDRNEIYIICLDIHDLKEARTELEQQRIQGELSSKLAALGEVTASVAHEIRNPLSAIITSMEMLRRQVDTGTIDASRVRALSARVLSTCSRINKIVDNLKGFSRSTQGELPQQTNLRQIVIDSVELIEQHFRHNRVRLIVNPVDEALQVWCKPVEISQVLINLLNNGLDAAKKHENPWVRLEVSANGDRATIRVVDSGMGIPRKVAEQIFTPFFTTKPPGAGTGLGLSISRRIIERHGGRLSLDPAAPHTTFVIELPVRYAAEQRAG